MLIQKRIVIIIIVLVLAIINFLFFFLVFKPHKPEGPNNTEDTDDSIFMQDKSDYSRDEKLSPDSQNGNSTNQKDYLDPSTSGQDQTGDGKEDSNEVPPDEGGSSSEGGSPLDPSPYVE